MGRRTASHNDPPVDLVLLVEELAALLDSPGDAGRTTERRTSDFSLSGFQSVSVSLVDGSEPERCRIVVRLLADTTAVEVEITAATLYDVLSRPLFGRKEWSLEKAAAVEIEQAIREIIGSRDLSINARWIL